MKQHSRVLIVKEAQSDFDQLILDFTKKHKLTYGEFIQILSTQITSETKYLIRWERHGDFDKEGDVDQGD